MRPFLGYKECLLSRVAVSVCGTCIMIQEEKSILCERIVSVIVTKKSLHEHVPFCSSDLIPSDLVEFGCRAKFTLSWIHETNCFYRILHAAVCMKKLERTTHELRTRVAKCIDFGGVIFFMSCNKLSISV